MTYVILTRDMAAAKRGSTDTPFSISISTETLLRVLFVVVIAGLLYFLWNVVLILLIAVLLSALIDPFADKLEGKKVPRGIAVLIIYLVIFSIGVGLFYLVVPTTVDQLGGLIATYGESISVLGVDTTAIQAMTAEEFLSQDITTLFERVRDAGLLESVPVVLEAIFEAFNVFLSVIIVVILSFYMVIEERELKKGIATWLTPPRYRDLVTTVMPKVREKLGYWLRGQLTIMLIVGVLVYIILTILGVPFALVLAITAALLEIIPFIGPFLSVVPAIIVALSVSPLLAGLVALFYFFVQQFEGDVLTPKVMQKVAGLNPVVSIVAILVGWELAGIAGALFAIPIAMVLGIFLQEWFNAKDKKRV